MVKPVKLTREELKEYYEDELKRVTKAVGETNDKLGKLQVSDVLILKDNLREKELRYAIHVGHMYIRRLEDKIKQLSRK